MHLTITAALRTALFASLAVEEEWEDLEAEEEEEMRIKWSTIVSSRTWLASFPPHSESRNTNFVVQLHFALEASLLE